MVLRKCSGCDQRPSEKPISVYYAWRNADGARRAYRATLCATCFMARIAPLDLDYATVERLTCPNCGIDTEADYDAIWATCYIPGYGERAIEAPFCNACAASYRSWALEHSEALEDRLGATGGPQPSPSAAEVLRQLGIQPRER